MTKYGFEQLQIGESVAIYGKEEAIRTSASEWGRRYGIWLQTRKALDGAIVVQRLEAPTRPTRKRKLSIEERLKQLEDGQRFIAIMVTKIHSLLEKSEE